MYHILVIHSSIDGYINNSYILVIVNNISTNICVHISVWAFVFTNLGYIASSQTAGSYGNSMLNFTTSYIQEKLKQMYTQKKYTQMFVAMLFVRVKIEIQLIYAKINSRWIKDLNVRLEILELLEENIVKTLFEIKYGPVFLDLPPKPKETIAKIKK